MPTTNIFAGSQGRVLRVGNVEGEVLEAWNSARGGATATGGFADGAMGNKNPAFGADIETTRGGDFQGYCWRTYMFFDTSAITTNITAINLSVVGVSPGGGDWRVVRANQDADFGTIATSDFNLAFNGATSFTSYSSAGTTWNISGLAVNTIALNSTAISNANGGGELCIGLLNNTYDYENNDMEEDPGNLLNGAKFASSGPNRPVLTITHAAGGYGNQVNTVAASSISNVIGVTSANIANVIGVS